MPRIRDPRFPGRLESVAFTIALAIVSGCSLGGPSPLPPPPVVAAPGAGAGIFDSSPLRGRIRGVRAHAFRLLAPHWSALREADRVPLQSVLLETFSEERLVPLVRRRLDEAAALAPEHASAALAWLRSPLGYEVKFAEATASGPRSGSGESGHPSAPALADGSDGSSQDAFFSQYAEVRDDRSPEIRSRRIRSLVQTAGLLESTLDLTEAVGLGVARLVNQARPDSRPLEVEALAEAVARERRAPGVAEAYAPVVEAAQLLRLRDLTHAELDGYLSFVATDSGHWYARVVDASLRGAVVEAVDGIEARLDAARGAPGAGQGFDPGDLEWELPSGRSVRMLGLAGAGPGSASAIVLRYGTSTAIAKDAAVAAAEAREVWEQVRRELEAQGARAAVLQAVGSVRGWVFPFASTRRYAWIRGADGRWREHSDGVRPFGALEREMLWSVPL